MNTKAKETIREKWREFFNECIHPDMNIWQTRMIEAIYYSGATSVIQIMLDSKDAPHLIEADIIHQLLNEIKKTNEQFKKGRDHE